MGFKGKYKDMDWWEKNKSIQKMAEHYGINVDEYDHQGTGYKLDNGPTKKSLDSLKAEINRRASNDWDVRESVAAAARAGNKKAQKIAEKGFSLEGDKGLSNIHAATKFMNKTHTKRMGLGGEYTERDQDHVSDYWIARDREKMLEPYALASDLEKNEAANSSEPVLKDIVLSEHMQKAKDRVDEWEATNPPVPVYREGIQQQAEGRSRVQLDRDIDIANLSDPSSFLENYKQEVYDQYKFRPEIG